jgi:hypothetical protein
MSKWAMIGVAAILAVAPTASAQYIGLFMDANASSCAAQVGPAPRIDLHVIAVLGGDVSQILGAEFRIRGAPGSWTPENVLWVPEPGVPVAGGNPIFPNPLFPLGGATVVATSCRMTDRVELGRIVLLGPPTGDNVRLWVTTTEVGGARVRCPAVISCEFGADYICVGGGEIVLNGSAPKNCQLAVEPRTWTTVKRLYD